MKNTIPGMKTISGSISFVVVLLALSVHGLPAQQRMHKERQKKVERVERLKQMQLMEDLQLGEEESVRFMAKRNAHERQMRMMVDKRGKMLDELALSLEDKAADQKIKAACDRVLDMDGKMFEARKQYQDEMRGLLSTGKYAKLLIFERDFQSQVRDAMRRSIGRSKSKYDR